MYNQSPEQVKSILDVWKIIEVIKPTKNENLNSYFELIKKHTEQEEKFYCELRNQEALFLLKDAPFENFDKQKLGIDLNENDVTVYWNIYLGYLKWSDAEVDIWKKIKRIPEINKEILADHTNQDSTTITPLAALIIDENMNYVKDSMVISTAAYALGEITKSNFNEEDFKKLVNFDDINNSLIHEALKLAEINQEGKLLLNANSINLIIDFLIKELRLDQKYLINRSEICVRRVTSSQKKKKEEEEKEKNPTLVYTPPLEMFNSFFLKPLDFVRNNIQNISIDSAIAKYLGQEDKPDSIDVLDNLAVFKSLLQPSKMQITRWPSSPKNSLAALQAASINSILLNSKEKLFAVNGPPGTGKTTLMFDIIANLYVERALKLSQLQHPSDGFDKQKNQACSFHKSFTHNIKPLKSDLQDYGIVIASSNNNAVENISKELPLKAKIDPIYLNELDIFSKLLTDQNSWGIFAAVLGNSTNRKDFISKFWSIRNYEDNQKAKTFTMRQYLNLLKNNNHKDHAPKNYKPEYCNSPMELENKWNIECQEFMALYKKITDIYNAIDTVINQNKKKRDILNKYEYTINEEEYPAEITKLNLTLKNIESEINEIEKFFKGFSLKLLEKIHTFYKTEKYHYFEERKDKLALSKEVIKKLDYIRELKSIKESLIKPIKFLENEDFNIKDFEEDIFWQAWEANHKELHKTTPFFNEKFERLRSELFIKATTIHEIFINANADNFWCSLNLFIEILSKPCIDIDPKIWHIAWQNFFMVVPVVSTTFHSFDNMFKYANHNDLPWLIIDEAGQAPPQYAVSAIYRAKNVVIVGDPMQTQPISTLKEDLIKTLCSKFNISFPDWSPSKVSAQHLADRNSLYQTKYSDVTVGFPLLVHRRCQNPMFDICNKIAYDNKMIFAASFIKSKLKEILGNSKWIDVVDDSINQAKHESRVEFNKLFELLKLIFQQEKPDSLLKQIYVITMYKNFSLYVKKNIKKRILELTTNREMIRELQIFCDKNIGTIHAFQGKEADTVIMLLGAQRSCDKGTRNLMTDKPNVLNVGISRAKNNLYIIGNKAVWLKHKHMQEIDNALNKYN
ncbi:DEAD/DEAH box helicase [Rickettsia endosymbiont of Halotydeus destructor]|uniref:DEAD/DEAH box helicase n=1 Tax=Rickettsia endosymbiont of Halotydeus destructor TaxID=2996754 RepID=UPI003BB0588D